MAASSLENISLGVLRGHQTRDEVLPPPINKESEEEETAIDSDITNHLQNEDENFNDIIEHHSLQLRRRSNKFIDPSYMVHV